jgi:hypothetical protein
MRPAGQLRKADGEEALRSSGYSACTSWCLRVGQDTILFPVRRGELLDAECETLQVKLSRRNDELVQLPADSQCDLHTEWRTSHSPLLANGVSIRIAMKLAE